jgi:hypothetical protein
MGAEPARPTPRRQTFTRETDQTYGDTLHTSEMATPGHGAHPQFDHDLV